MAVTFSDEEQTTLFGILGLPENTDPTDTAGILAVIEDLAKQAEPSKPSDVAAAAKKLGLEAVDETTLAALRSDAAEGRQIKAAAAKAKIADQVDDAVKHGKIAASRREHWVTLITADPGMADVLASVPNETAVPMTEVGHGSDGGDVVEAAAWFR